MPRGITYESVTEKANEENQKLILKFLGHGQGCVASGGYAWLCSAARSFLALCKSPLSPLSSSLTPPSVAAPQRHDSCNEYRSKPHLILFLQNA